MFSHLCMKYIFFLLAIATIVAGIPLEETRNLTLSRRQAPVLCPDPRFPVKQSAHCRTRTVVAVVCAAQDFPNSYILIDHRCEPETSCVDFIRPDSTPFAACVLNSQIEAWDNGHDYGIMYGRQSSFKLDADILTFGMTTYDTNSNPIQVRYLDVSVNNADLAPSFDENHYGRVYNNYVAGQIYQFSFATGTNQTATALAAVFAPSGPNGELTALSLE